MMRIEENVPLATSTTLKIGGHARYVIRTEGEADVAKAYAFAHKKDIPAIPLGAGSNILAPDNPVNAVFIRHVDDALTRLEEYKDHIEILAHGGLSWDAFVSFCVSKEWWGIENLSGIPGTVGASAVQNIGAYGVALGDTVLEVIAYDSIDRQLKHFSREECAFGYRTSIFKQTRDRYFITRIRFRLSKSPLPKLAYRDVANFFSENSEMPSIGAIRSAIIQIRSKKFPPLTTYGTAGSFFLNPVLSVEEAHNLQSRFSGMPLFDMPEGGVKVPLAWIFDHVLHLKGFRIGKVFLWEEQPLVIVTEHGATSADVHLLYKKIHQLVKDKVGINIVPEVRIFD